MTLQTDFQSFFQELEQDDFDEVSTSIKEITKKLNKEYYELDQDEYTHMYIVGSVGRGTAIKHVSDIDLIFDLPPDLFSQYNNHETNGQSNLLQNLKGKLLNRYPKTDIRGDGQVVVIEFDKYTVELVPAFKQSDNSFKYPDTNDGGSWKISNPLPEIEECKKCEESNKGLFFNFCHLMRAWKNTIGFRFGGLLIDTLVFNFLSSEKCDSKEYIDVLKALFKYLSEQNTNRNYWLALGSNQQVQNTDNGKFVVLASKALDEISNAEESQENLNDVLRELFGRQFPAEKSKSLCEDSFVPFGNTEQFIEDKFNVDINYSLAIDCEVRSKSSSKAQNLSTFLRNGFPLEYDKELRFYIANTDCPKPYDVYWKIRNVGAEAIKRKDIRGQINPGSGAHKEITSFSGPHYVECFLIKNGICVARDRIDVPIKVMLPKKNRWWKF